MNDELTRWADAARDYKAKLDWATTALCDILELASGNKCDPDYTAIEGLIAGTVEAVRALKSKLEQAHKAAAEMRDVLVTLDHKRHLLAEGHSKELIDFVRSIHDALSTDCGKDYVHKSQVDRLRDELTRLRDIVSEADVALIDQALEETK